MKKLLLNLLLVGSLFAGTYDDPYNVLDKSTAKNTEKLDPFMYGDFLEIIRFEGLDFSDEELSNKSEEYLQEILDTVNSYINNKKDIRIKIIGHSDEKTDIKNELNIDSDTYANAIQNIFRYSLSEEEALDNSSNYASKIAEIFKNNSISQDILTVEHRTGKDMGFSSGTDKGRFLSNRVMVTMYVLTPPDKDTDGDGVLDAKDKCPNTPKGLKVDEDGCLIDSDRDGVYDYQDECPDTPLGVAVDKKGCPFDTDEDGVLDYKDECPDTMKGLSVDVKGCPVSMVLKLNFETDSYGILENSKEKVLEFAEFLKDNSAYNANIIGHTDSTGKEGYNMNLSQNRANSVKDMLVDNGIDESRLDTQGRGELDPLETNRTAEGRASNRRIEVKLFN